MHLFRAALAAFVVSPLAAATATKPNILFILAEDVGPQFACYGEPLARTPHLDALAARGVRYTQAFTTAPVCSTSRSAIMTGMYQTTIGAHQHRTWTWNKKPLPAGVKPITDYFRSAGYFTANLSAGPGKAKKSAASGLRITGRVRSRQNGFQFHRRENPSTATTGTNGQRANRSSRKSRSPKATRATAGLWLAPIARRSAAPTLRR